MLENINWIAVAAAAVANMVIGMVWYAKSVFGAKWMALSGISDAQVSESKRQGMAGILAAEFVAALVTAAALAVLVDVLASETVVHAVKLAAGVWLGFIAAPSLGDYLFGRRPLALFVLNTGNRLVSVVAMAVVVTLWR